MVLLVRVMVESQCGALLARYVFGEWRLSDVNCGTRSWSELKRK